MSCSGTFDIGDASAQVEPNTEPVAIAKITGAVENRRGILYRIPITESSEAFESNVDWCEQHFEKGIERYR